MEDTYFSCIFFNLSFSFFFCFLGFRLGSKFPFIWNLALSTCSLWPRRSYPSSNFKARSTDSTWKIISMFLYTWNTMSLVNLHIKNEQPNLENKRWIWWHNKDSATKHCTGLWIKYYIHAYVKHSIKKFNHCWPSPVNTQSSNLLTSNILTQPTTKVGSCEIKSVLPNSLAKWNAVACYNFFFFASSPVIG